MDDYFANIIFGAVDPRLLSITIITGFLIFLMYFYKSKLWCGFSDFDKLSFSIVCGFIVFLGFVVPLARIIFALNNLINGFVFVEVESEEIIATYQLIYSYILLGLFVLAFISPEPLYENFKIFKNIFVGYFTFICILSILYAELTFALLLSQFRDYILTISGNISMSIFFMVIFFGVYLAVHKKSNTLIFKEIKEFPMKFRLKKIHSILFLLSLILLPCVFGTFLFSYKVTENEEHINLVSIKKIDLERNVISSARELIFRDYSIKMPILISWAKVKPDLILKNEFDNEDNLKYSVLKDENAFVVNKTSNIVNVTVSLYNDTDISYSKMVMFEEPTFTNDSLFMNVSLKNYLLHNIEIEELSIPIPEGYTLEENDFVKTQRFADNRGSILGYSIKEGTLFLTNLRLEKNASGTIMLKLVKTREYNP